MVWDERGIERVKKLHHTTIINWVKQVGKLLPDCYDPQTTRLGRRIR